MIEAIAEAGAALRALLPDWLGWLATLFQRTLLYLAGPLVDNPGRFHWIGLIAALVLSLIVFLQLRAEGRLRGEGFLGWLFPRRIIRHPSTWVDLKVGFVNSVVIGNALNVTWRLNSALIVAGITALLTALFGPGPQDFEWSWWSILLMAVVLSMAADLGYFLFHWASHVFPPLWAIHKLHHSAEVLSPLTTARVHPLERAILGPFRAVTVGLVMGPVLYLFAGEASVITVLGIELMALLFRALGFVLHHSHVPLYFGPKVGRIIVSPLQHQVHHSSLPPHLDKNFAEFWAFWDWIFGTLYLPKRNEALRFGLAGRTEQLHPTLTRAYLVPVAEAARESLVLAGRVAARLGLRGRPAPPPRPAEGER
jgi:sterol desaturase/sphingolipid hydroxylase (fatty acid hydroxylase superfamily)